MKIYVLRLRSTGGDDIRSLRAALKILGRRYGLRCLRIDTEILASPNGARRRRDQIRAPRRTTMDMSQFSGERFVKIADVADGPIPERIAGVRMGRYEKPDLVFENGDILSLNQTNTDILCRAYGAESDDWTDKQVELYQGEIKYQGQMQPAVKVRPISPTVATTFGDPALNDEIPY
jgi:hypothetical protein